MIGDWVSDPFGNAVVVNIDARDGLLMYYRNRCYATTSLSNIEPIPITAEILDMNGLDKVPELSMVLNRDTMPMYHSPMLHYVHELQHALRLCGLTELADNFKVD